MKRAQVCGAGGFVAGHLVEKLQREGYWVRGVDLKPHEFTPTQADEFLLLDLRHPENCRQALTLPGGGTFDEVCQLAAEMGGRVGSLAKSAFASRCESPVQGCWA